MFVHLRIWNCAGSSICAGRSSNAPAPPGVSESRTMASTTTRRTRPARDIQASSTCAGSTAATGDPDLAFGLLAVEGGCRAALALYLAVTADRAQGQKMLRARHACDRGAFGAELSGDDGASLAHRRVGRGARVQRRTRRFFLRASVVVRGRTIAGLQAEVAARVLRAEAVVVLRDAASAICAASSAPNASRRRRSPPRRPTRSAASSAGGGAIPPPRRDAIAAAATSVVRRCDGVILSGLGAQSVDAATRDAPPPRRARATRRRCSRLRARAIGRCICARLRPR